MTVYIDNYQHPLIIYSGAHFSIVAREYMEKHSPNWEEQLFSTKAKNCKSASWKMTSIVNIIKEIIHHRKDYQQICCIEIYNSKNRNTTIGTNKEEKVLLVIYHLSNQDPLEELLNELKEEQFSANLTTKQKLSLLKIFRKNRPASSIGEKSLIKIGGHDIILYLYVERPYPFILRRPPYPESVVTRNKIEKPFNELLGIDFIRKIGHIEIVEVTTPVLITWNDGKSRLCGDFRAPKNHTKPDSYPISRIANALDKLAKAKYITKINCMNGFHQNGVKPNSMRLLIIVCHIGINEYSRMPFCNKNAPATSKGLQTQYFKKKYWKDGWRNPLYDPEVAGKIPIHFMEIDRKKNFRFSEWEPGSGTPDTSQSEPEETETFILVIRSSDLHN
ncbi:hypothetical protein O181_044973 [Austropuccinia psidii MF-1]|uniref:Uncharacterized protein n=1 Tax=Austropuccinia psidii MF-1 TaxID=1389203 RepID=A0A9Q3DR50_9BASI|nr:hypothetical protein [Austropuccinia psidii MF-1]